jgi:hypothetical protein
MTFTGFNILFLFAFLLSAAVQLNDPDSLIWVAMYLSAAAMCAAQLAKRQPRWLPSALALVALVWIISLLPNIAREVPWAGLAESISMRSQAVEEARELGGLSIILIWALCLLTRQQSSKS